MANEEHLAKLNEGVEAWNAWRKENPKIKPDLREADLSESHLGRANFSEADLTKADLFQAVLTEANLSKAFLTGANLAMAQLDEACLTEAHLDQADLGLAYLVEANLRRASLSQADLIEANLFEADLTGTNLSKARFCSTTLLGTNFVGAHVHETIFADLDLSAARGLDTCLHAGPSIVDHRTFIRSEPLPISFLRGCGLPDRLIEYLPSLTGKAIAFYSCFISYSSKNQQFANRLHADLQDSGVRCWFAPEDLKIGDELRPTFDRAIRLRDKLLVVLSVVSLTRPWVKREVEQALDEEDRRGKSVLFPIRLDDAILDVTEGWATDLKRRHIGDFTNWKDHDSYQAAFERLLRDLRQLPEDTTDTH